MSNDRLPRLSKKVGSVRNLISNFETSNLENHSKQDDEITKLKNENNCKNTFLNLYELTELSESESKCSIPKNEETGIAQKESHVDSKIVDSPDVKESHAQTSNEDLLHEAKISVNEHAPEIYNSDSVIKEYCTEKTANDNLSNTNGVSNSAETIVNDKAPSPNEMYLTQETSSSLYSSQNSAIEPHVLKDNFSVENVKNAVSFIGTSNSKETSDWDSGNFLKQFGIDSSTKKFSNSNKSGNTIVATSETKNKCNQNQTLISVSEETSNSTNSFVDMSWQFGDIDGLEKISTKSKQGTINQIVNSSSNNTDLTQPWKVARKRSVSFSEEKNDIHYLDSKPDDKSNPWKYICYGIMMATLFFYVMVITFKEFFTQQHPTIIITETDVFEFFNGTSNHTRDYILKKLLEKYRFSSSNGLIPTLQPNPAARLVYGPRYNDDKIKSVYNNFENINPDFHDDYEIQQLMESDNLKFMFSGIAYAPENVIEPECGASYREVVLDVARLSTITGKLKTYGTQCNQSDYILEAIMDLKLNMTLALGVWISHDKDVNQKQIDKMKYLLQKYPSNLIDSIFVGNEVLFREDQSISELLEYVNNSKTFLNRMNITNIPVGTSEMGSAIVPELFDVCDFVGVNVHPFFAGVEAQFGTRWVLDYFYNTLSPHLFSSLDTQRIFISEIGWPYKGGEFNKAVAGSWEFQQFLNDWLCTAPAEILNSCFYFEAFDESWKKIWWEGNHTWETEWGFFDNKRQMKKHIYVPDCSKYCNPAMADFSYIGGD